MTGFEFDGLNPRWYNGLSTHFHYPYIENAFVKNNDSYKRFKVYSGELNEQKCKIPGGINFWDGQFHTWEFVVTSDMTYVNITTKNPQGQERWYEMCRAKTAPTYLERLDLQLHYAYKAEANAKLPKDFKYANRYDFVVAWVEVLQRAADVSRVLRLMSPVLLCRVAMWSAASSPVRRMSKAFLICAIIGSQKAIR